MANHWNIQRLYNDVISDRDTCLQWCEEQKLVPLRRFCTEGHEMFIVQDKTFFGQFRCSKKHTNGKKLTISRTRGSVFEGKRMSPEKLLILMYSFAHDLTYRDCIIESSIEGSITSKETVYEFYSFFRELLTQHYLEFERFNQIGGKDKAVEILDFYLSKPKFKVGSYDEDICIAVMVELETKFFCVEICNENKWNSENLCPLIKKNVAKGSIIILRGSKDYSIHLEGSYSIQDAKDYILTFKDSNCMNSNLDVNNFSAELLSCKKYDVQKCISADKLLEFLHKCGVKRKDLDPFETFLDIIRHRYLV